MFRKLDKRQMIIDCISDLHGYYPELEGGDLLIIAGDCTKSDKLTEWAAFFSWLKKQKYKKKIIVAGNHDNFFYIGSPKNQKEANDLKEIVGFLDIEEDFEYLCNSGTEFEGLKIWGAPWSLWFKGINSKCKAFTGNESYLRKHWCQIPRDIDILITHTPPHGIFDSVESYKIPEQTHSVYDQQIDETYRAGSVSLRHLLLDGSHFSKLKLHVFGHIHEHGGQVLKTSLCTFVNASIMDEKYHPVNKPVRIDMNDYLSKEICVKCKLPIYNAYKNCSEIITLNYIEIDKSMHLKCYIEDSMEKILNK